MQKTLVISDHPALGRALEQEFSQAGWSSRRTSFNGLLRRTCESIADFSCLTVVVDRDFCKRFACTMEEMHELLRSLSRHVHVYLVFERGYDPTLVPWLDYTRRFFTYVVRQPQQLKQAIAEIVWLETDPLEHAAFVSPMNT